MKNKIQVSSLLKLIGEDTLSSLAIETNVNYKSKKLSGEVVFKLLMMALLDNTNVSLRVMEKMFSKAVFKLYAGLRNDQSIRHSSLSERLTTINCRYFEKIFNHVFEHSQCYFDKELLPYNIRQFDSTSLSLSSKLLKKGMVNGLKNKDGVYAKKNR